MDWRKWFLRRGDDEERRYRAYKERFLFEQKQEQHCRPSALGPTPSAISYREDADGPATGINVKGSGA